MKARKLEELKQNLKRLHDMLGHDKAVSPPVTRSEFGRTMTALATAGTLCAGGDVFTEARFKLVHDSPRAIGWTEAR